MNTLEKLKEMFSKVFDGDIDASNVTETTRLKEDLGLNSIAMLYMAIAVEEKFGTKFSNNDFEKIHTVGDCIAKIEGRLK